MDPILGQIILWPLNWVPDGWMACEGQELSIQANTPLYSLLGTTYGGNGSTTFKLPDLRSRVPLGAQIPTQVGSVSGAAAAWPDDQRRRHRKGRWPRRWCCGESRG